MSVEPDDIYVEGVSNCCDARILVTGLCSECLEPCDIAPDE